MKQVRKFEQDAIVNEIIVGVNERIDLDIKQEEKTKEFKACKKLVDQIEKIRIQRDALSVECSDLETMYNKYIRPYNETFEDKTYAINPISYSNSGISWSKNTWALRDKVADKLAIALLDPNAQNRIKDIIKAIAKEVA